MEFTEKIEARLARIESMLLANKIVLTFDEVALFTGLSKSYLYKLTSARLIPHYKPLGKQLFFNREEVSAWLQSRAVVTDEELDGQAANYLTLKKRTGNK